MATQFKENQILDSVVDGFKYGVIGAVAQYSNLPSASSVDNGDIYIVTTDEGANLAGFWQSNGVDTWTRITGYGSTFVGLNDTPASYSGAKKIITINDTNDGIKFSTITEDDILAENLCEGGGSHNLAGGKLTEKFMNFTKSFQPIQ